MISFAWPWMILLLPLPWVWQRFIKHKPAAPQVHIRFPKIQQLNKAFAVPDDLRFAKFNVRQILLTIAWLCLVISLMRPEIIEDLGYMENNGYDLLLAVDLSRSMDTVDFVANGRPISRIAATKNVVGDFVRRRDGDRVGLIVFADHAYMTVPLTLDTYAVGKMLDNLLVGMAGDSTAIGDAIGIGVNVLRKRPTASRVLILLTDGQDNSSHIPPLMAAKIAQDSKVKIYTIGVGNQLDLELLTKIAKMTGGTYSEVKNVHDLEAVYNEIDRLEKSDAKQRTILFRKPLYYIFTGLALLCCIAAYLYSKGIFGRIMLSPKMRSIYRGSRSPSRG